MSLVFTQDFKTEKGSSISVTAGDGDFVKLSIEGSVSVALTSKDAANLVVLLQSLGQAKLADARLKANAPKS